MENFDVNNIMGIDASKKGKIAPVSKESKQNIIKKNSENSLSANN